MSSPKPRQLLSPFAKLHAQNGIGSQLPSMCGRLTRCNRNGRLPALVALLSCALVGYQSALFLRRGRLAQVPGLSPEGPRLVSLDDDGGAAAMPAWSMPWFSSAPSQSSPHDAATSSSSSVTSNEFTDDVGDDIEISDSAGGDGGGGSVDDEGTSAAATVIATASRPLPGWETRVSRPPLGNGVSASFAALTEAAAEYEDDMEPQQEQRSSSVQLTAEASALLASKSTHSRAVPKVDAMTRLKQEKKSPKKLSSRDLSRTRKSSSLLPTELQSELETQRSSTDVEKTLTIAPASASVATTATTFDSLVASSVERQRHTQFLRNTSFSSSSSLGDGSSSSEKGRPGIAFLKTHKCGSSTLGSIFFRYAARHQRRMPFIHHNIAAGHELRNNVTTCDIALQHIQATKWKYALDWYTRAVARPVFVTILRHPVSHYASWAHFFKLPETSVAASSGLGASAVTRPLTLDEFVVSSAARKNPMAHSVGLYRAAHLRAFIDTFSLIVIMEHFDQGLILLKRLMDWDLVDLTYFKINDSHQKTTQQSAPNSAKEATSSTTTPPLSSSGLRRSWDGLPVTPSPKVSAMSHATRQRIESLTSGLDTPLYDMAMKKFQNQIDSAGLDSVAAEQLQFQRLQTSLSGLCSKTAGSDVGGQHLTRADFKDGGEWTSHLRDGWKKETPPQSNEHGSQAGEFIWGCRWYALADLQYEKQITSSGLAPPISFSTNNPVTS